MKPARLSAPPRFVLAGRDGARLTLQASNGAVAHVFVLEDDVMRVLLLPGGVVTSPPSWAIAPGQADIAETGRDRMDTQGFACPDYVLAEAEGLLTRGGVAVVLGVSVRTVDRMKAAGEIRAVTLRGWSVRFVLGDVLESLRKGNRKFGRKAEMGKDTDCTDFHEGGVGL